MSAADEAAKMDAHIQKVREAADYEYDRNL